MDMYPWIRPTVPEGEVMGAAPNSAPAFWRLGQKQKQTVLG
jgi:hypothetical protein